MKTKTRLLAFTVAAMAAMTMAGLTACGGEGGGDDDTTHTHSYSGYTSTADGHYQVCEDCGESTEVSEHEYDDVYDGDCNVCGYSRGTASARLEAYLTEVANPEVEGIDANYSTYEEMESYFVEQGIITSEQVANRVDILTTAGYLNILDDSYNSYDGAYAFADAAYDYDGLWLLWFGGDSDMAANTWSNSTSWGAIDSGSLIVAGGGAVTMSIETYNGYFVLGFADDYDETAKASAVTLFESITASTLFSQYTVTDLVSELRSAGWLSASDVLNAVDLNAQYTYTIGETTNYAYLASAAYTYGNITIYYFDTSDSWYSYSLFPYILANLEDSLTTVVYFDPVYGNSYNWYWGTDEEYVYKYNSSNEYDADGTTLSYSIDFIIGNFAISVSD